MYLRKLKKFNIRLIMIGNLLKNFNRVFLRIDKIETSVKEIGEKGTDRNQA